MHSDMWDGTVIEFSSIVNNYAGIFSYFMDSHWYLQYFLSLIIIKISQLLPIGYKDTNAIFVFFTMLFVLYESMFFVKKIFNFEKAELFFFSILFSISPVWNVMLSSIMLLHLFCFGIGLLSIRLLHCENQQRKFIGMILIFISFNLQSLFLFLPVLSFIYDIKIRDSQFFKLGSPSKITLVVFIFSLTTYIIFNFIFPPIGNYKDYNKLSVFSSQGIFNIFYGGLNFSSLLVPIFFISILLILILILLKGINFDKLNLDLISGIRPALILFLSGIIPYILVGKSTHLIDVNDWIYRQAILTVLPQNILIILIWKKFNYIIRPSFLFLNSIFIACLISLNILILSYSVILKVNRQIFIKDLENLLEENIHKIPKGGILQIKCNEISKPAIRVYESNFLVFNATGSSKYWSQVNHDIDKNFQIPSHIINEFKHQLEYNFTYDPSYKDVETHIIIESNNYFPTLNTFDIFCFRRVKSMKIIDIFNKNNNN
uniref:hypothetical protein n=1 Tax=Algoriphagus sp. TaxID=1872435 RepID=UPI0040486BAB